MPFFSIVSINFNQGNDLAKTLESVKRQSFKDYESIVIDGGSRDNSLAVINTFEETITRWVSEKDKGIYDAMNKGAGMAEGQWILFLNAGDYFISTQTLKRCYDALINSACPLAYGKTRIRYSDMSRYHQNGDTDTWKRMPYIHQSLFYTNETCRKFPFNHQLNICADYDQYLRMREAGIQFKMLDFPVSEVSAGGKSDVHRDAASLEKRKIFLKLYPDQKLKATYFFYESLKGKITRQVKKILPGPAVKLFRKLKYKIL